MELFSNITAALCGKRGNGVEFLPCNVSGLVFIIALAGDHGAIITAQRQRRHIEFCADFSTFLFKRTANVGIGCNATGNG